MTAQRDAARPRRRAAAAYSAKPWPRLTRASVASKDDCRPSSSHTSWPRSRYSASRSSTGGGTQSAACRSPAPSRRAPPARCRTARAARPHGHRCWCRLEIGDEASRAGAPANAAARAVELRGERRRVARAGGEDLLLQKVQPPIPLLPSRLGQVSRVKRDLVHPLAMPLQHGAAKSVDAVGQDAHAANDTNSGAMSSGFTPVCR